MKPFVIWAHEHSRAGNSVFETVLAIKLFNFIWYFTNSKIDRLLLFQLTIDDCKSCNVRIVFIF